MTSSRWLETQYFIAARALKYLFKKCKALQSNEKKFYSGTNQDT